MAFAGVEPTDTDTSTFWVSQHHMPADSFLRAHLLAAQESPAVSYPAFPG